MQDETPRPWLTPGLFEARVEEVPFADVCDEAGEMSGSALLRVVRGLGMGQHVLVAHADLNGGWEPIAARNQHAFLPAVLGHLWSGTCRVYVSAVPILRVYEVPTEEGFPFDTTLHDANLQAYTGEAPVHAIPFDVAADADGAAIDAHIMTHVPGHLVCLYDYGEGEWFDGIWGAYKGKEKHGLAVVVAFE